MRTALFHRMREFLQFYDALILPVAPLAAFDAELQYPPVVAGLDQGDYLGWMRTVCHVTVTGHPVISMPAGFTAAGTPLGVQIVGRHRGERELLMIAKGFETATGYWLTPTSVRVSRRFNPTRTATPADELDHGRRTC